MIEDHGFFFANFALRRTSFAQGGEPVELRALRETRFLTQRKDFSGIAASPSPPSALLAMTAKLHLSRNFTPERRSEQRGTKPDFERTG